MTQGLKDWLRCWWPVAGWMALIFVMSTGALAAPQTSRVLGPLFRWLFPAISDIELQRLVFFIRKGAHMFEYAILAALIWRSHRLSYGATSGLPGGASARAAFLIAAGYGVTDELHQLFVPSRQASVLDVGLDALGALLAIGLIALAQRWKRGPTPAC